MLAVDQQRMQISLTDRCQLSCRYCFLDRREPHDLSWPSARKAVLDFLRSTTSLKTIAFYGGEPLLAFPLLKKIVNAARREQGANGVAFHLTTNGILLDRKVADFCAARSIRVALSIDGGRERQDRERPGAAGGSYAAVVKALGHLKASGAAVTANMVIRPDDAATWVGNFKKIVALGFPQVQLLPDSAAVWRPADVVRLRRSLGDFVEFNIDCFEGQRRHLFAVEPVRRLLAARGRRAARGCEKRILAADGKYYGCDKAFACSREQRSAYQAGDAIGGFDFLQRKKVLGRLYRCLPSAGHCRDCRWAAVCFCPAGIPLLSSSLADRERRWRAFCRISDLLLTSCARIIAHLKENSRFRAVYGLTQSGEA